MNGDFKTKILIEKSKQEKKNNNFLKLTFFVFFVLILILTIFIFKDNFKEYLLRVSNLQNKDTKSEKNLQSEKYNFKDEESNKSKIDLIEEDLKRKCLELEVKKDDCTYKNLFQIALKNFNNKANKFLSNKNLSQMFPIKYDRVIDLKESSLEKFHSGSYDSAYSHIMEAEKIFSAIYESSRKEFKINMKKALLSFSNRNKKEASFYISNAEKYFPENNSLLLLKERISKISIISKIEKEIAQANTMEKYNLEIKLIYNLKKIDKLITKYDKRLDELNQLSNKKKFEDLVIQIRRLLELNNFELAKEKLREASALLPENRNIVLLQSEINKFEKLNKINVLKQDIEKDILEEKWNILEKKYSEILRLDDTNYFASEGLKKAKLINMLLREIKKLNDEPLLLVQDQNLKKANMLLRQAGITEINSKELLKLSKSLSENINLVNEPAAVSIISDNKTEITLRKIGIIGKITSKTLKLKPGKYIFEGKRKGYKTILVNKLIAIDEKKVYLELICNEPVK